MDNATCPVCGHYNAMLATWTPEGTVTKCRDCGHVPACHPGCSGAKCHCQSCGEPGVLLNDDDICAECESRIAADSL